ncbi:AGD6 [Symbiodinium necroappetens]|uniref:AGD6 protein n=1 Tax=Symbiodinium necroappetens TaxID=1628268 RepID=A0A813B627_9DINO|nr:AGD6 [Symbiodinium necroappetens]
MASWLTGRVASLVKEPRQAWPAADEAQQTLEQRARALTSPHSAAWLLSHWLEQCNSSEVYVQCQGASGSQGGARAWQLSFQQVLLRSSAFELVLEVCAKVPSVREALTPGPASASALLEQSKSLRQALHGMAERLLLPGALEVWPSLFDALLSRDSAGALPWDSWARRLVAALKKPWRLESLWPQLRRWDTAAAEELGGSDTASSTTLKATGAQGLSKQGIRAELIRRRFPQLALEAGRLRSRSEALCDGLEALRTVDGMGGVSCKEIEQLIQDASLALDSLDSGVQGSRDEARQLGQALSDAGSAVQRQMATVMLTQETFVARRGQLQNEKEQLAKRLQELDAEVTQLDQEASRCNQQIRQLQAQFSHNTSHYDGLLGGSAAFSEELGDRKAKAMAFRDCAAAALNVAKAAEAKQRTELETQRRRRASDLRRQVAAYVRKERTRLEAAAEFAELVAGRGTGKATPPREDAAEELMEATVLAQEVWRSVQVLLQRVDALGENRADSEVIASSSEMLASSAESQAFFLKAAEEDLCVCADCSALGSEWASVSYGIYLCVDCAGRHRGLGVHLSFVRSLAMDRWTPSQLRRMELGGSLRFRAFLAPFGLCDSSDSADSSLHARYSSRAASFYRRRLDAECRGQAFGDVPPSREEGRQIADPATFTAEEIDPAADGEGESLAAERQQLEEKFLAVQGWLQQVLQALCPTVSDHVPQHSVFDILQWVWEEFDSSIHLVEEAVHQLLKKRGVDRPPGKLRFRHVPRALAARSLCSLKEIRYSLVGKFITASGLVARIGVVKAVAATRSFQCAACRRSFSVASLGALGHEAPHCPGGDGLFCGSTDLQELGGTMTDYQEIRLQDVVPGSVGTTLKVILVADLAGSAVPGDIVVIGGILRAVWPRSRAVAELVLDASDVRHSKEVPSRSRSLFLGAPSDAMAQRAELLRSVVPGLQGLEVAKLALLLTLVGGGPYNPPVPEEVERWSRFMPEDESDATPPAGKKGIQEAKMRLSTHLLFVGDAATGKTKLIEQETASVADMATVRPRRSSRTVLICAGVALAGLRGGFVLPTERAGGTLRSSGRQAHICRAVPLRMAEGYERVEDESMFSMIVETGTSSPSVTKLEVVLPEERDLEPISHLVLSCFPEVVDAWLLPEALGGVAWAWNGLVKAWERSVIRTSLSVNFQRVMKRPSLRKPWRWQFEGDSLGLLLVEEGDGPISPVAFCELCILPASGCSPDDFGATMSMIIDNNQNTAQPYLQNFCVAPKWRRKGVGRAMLQMIEKVVVEVWNGDRLYLHAAGGKASERLYGGCGYEATGLSPPGEPSHMVKSLEVEDVGLPDSEEAQEVCTRSLTHLCIQAEALAVARETLHMIIPLSRLRIFPHMEFAAVPSEPRVLGLLTVACVRDGAGWSLEAGALSLADGGVCCIDEFRHLAAEEKAALYEAVRISASYC